MSDLKTTISAWIIQICGTVVPKLPLAIRTRIVYAIGSLYGSIPHAQRRGLEQNLRELFGMPDADVRRTAKEIFRNFTMTLYDFFVPKGLVMTAPDRALLESIRKKHGGVLMLTFHMGNWELGARTMAEWGWPVTAVYQPYRNRKFKEVIEALRAPGVNFIPVGGQAANGVREALRRGDVVAMLGDLPFGEDGTPVKLLGKYVMWPKGPVLLAVRESAPIVIAVITRTAPRHYRAVIEPALIPREKTRAEVDRLTQEVADRFGRLLTQYPAQWYRFRPFEFTQAPSDRPVRRRQGKPQDSQKEFLGV